MSSKTQTEKCGYPSVYSPGQYVTLAQYLCEKICERAARKEYKELPVKFWQIKKWANFYKWQMKPLHQLLKEYRPDAVLKAFNDKRCKTVYSFNAPWFIEVVKEYNNKKPVKIAESTEEVQESKGLRPSTGKNSLASLLD